MASFQFFIKGVLIGSLFGFPVGAVGTMTIGRTLNHGFAAGLVTGFGSSVADCIYAGIGAFGLSFITEYLLKYENVIHFLGGILVMAMGIGAFVKKQDESSKKSMPNNKLLFFLSSFGVGITNPAAILTFLFAFSYFDLSTGMNLIHGVMLVCGVMTGTFAWWTILSVVAVRFRERALRHRTLVNRLLGAVLMVFGLTVLVSALYQS